MQFMYIIKYEQDIMISMHHIMILTHHVHLYIIIRQLWRSINTRESAFRDPHSNGLNDELENLQKRAARFVPRNYNYETGSMTGILEELKWETLQKRRKDSRLILLYKGLKGKARIPTDDLIPKNRP